MMAKRDSGSGFGEFEFLRLLSETPGVSGREERVRDLIATQTRDFWDETRVDQMGSLICLKRAERKQAGKRRRSGDAGDRDVPRVMLACHMDEIGFYVRYVDENGYLRLQNAGGFDTRNLFARRVLVQGKRDLVGVLNPGVKPVHISSQEERNKVPEMQDFYVDLLLPKRQVQQLVDVGDPVTMMQDARIIGDAVVGKAMDNRVALWVGINAVRKACGMDYLTPDGGNGRTAARRRKTGASGRNHLRYDVYFVACVQEEVGLRGAQTAAYAIDPDVGVAIDVTLSCDTPGVSKDDAITQLGNGVAVKVMDSASISHRGLFDEFIKIAKQRKIPHQREVLPRGGTDAGAVQRARGGRRAITISVPTRYIHTITEAVHRKDARAAVDLLAAWLAA
jgi:putative aminopeptidase FrvX